MAAMVHGPSFSDILMYLRPHFLRGAGDPSLAALIANKPIWVFHGDSDVLFRCISPGNVQR